MSDQSNNASGKQNPDENLNENNNINTNPAKLPVYIITGFLGSGKTTLLNHWVQSEAFRDTLVLINEFGDVGLDHELVQQVDDQVMLLDNGCICCSLQGALIDTLSAALAKSRLGRLPAFSRVLIETTGVADPAGVITTLNNDQFLFDNFYHAGTVTVMDAKFIRTQLKNQYEAVKQIALADLLLISKTDLVDEEEVEEIYEAARQINPHARILPVINGELSPRVLEETGPYRDRDDDVERKLANWLKTPQKPQLRLRPVQASGHVGEARAQITAHSDISSFSYTYENPINPVALMNALSAVAQYFGDSILRIKGILNLEGQSKPVVVHGISSGLYPLTELPAWRTDKPSTRLVFIVKQAVAEPIRAMFERLVEHPDREALRYYYEQLEAYDAEQQAVSTQVLGSKDEAAPA